MFFNHHGTNITPWILTGYNYNYTDINFDLFIYVGF